MATQVEQALAEAYASAPQDLIVLDTLEIHHRTFDEPIRIVRWPVTGPKPEIFKLKLDNKAPHNPGQIVQFVGCPFELVPPSQSTDEVIGSFQLKIDNMDDLLDEYLENAALDGGVITGIYRTYIRGMEAQGPASIFSGLEFDDPRFEGMTFIISAAVLRWAQRPYGRIYTALEYPALVTGR